MESAKHEVTGFGSGDRERDRLQVAHFTHHDDVGVLTQRSAKRRSEGDGVRVDLALRYVAIL